MNRLLEVVYTEYAKNRASIRSGFISGENVELLRELLNIEYLSNNGLQVLRNAIVKFFHDKSYGVTDWREDEWLMDCVSAWTTVIDQEKWNRGLEV